VDDEWADAINSEMGVDTATADKIEEEVVKQEPKADEPQKTDDVTDDATDDDAAGKSDDKKEEIVKEEISKDASKDKPVDEPSAKDEPAEKFVPKETIKDALRELESEKVQTSADAERMKKSVLDAFYPEGIDRQLRDSDGDPITGIEDMTKLINPKTNDYFTEDEAGAWLLASQQKLNKDIEQLEEYAAGIVETNMTLKEGADRVQEIYGDLLAKLPEVADQVLEAYQKTLVKDPNTGIVIKAPVDVVGFYDVALGGYKKVAEQMNIQAEADAIAAKKAAEEKARAGRAERGDLFPRGSSELPLGEEEQGWDTAMDQYYNNKK
jgi:hypothetical protein